MHQDHWPIILRNGLRNATESQWNNVLSKLITENVQSERLRLIESVSFHTNVDLIKLYLNMSIAQETTYFRTEAERYQAFSDAVGVSQNNTKLGFNLLLEHFDTVVSRYGQTNVINAINRLSLFVVNEERNQQVTD